ncbi:hypothetical protein GGF50DRAFT_130242 [Schizophyllum commune]
MTVALPRASDHECSKKRPHEHELEIVYKRQKCSIDATHQKCSVDATRHRKRVRKEKPFARMTEQQRRFYTAKRSNPEGPTIRIGEPLKETAKEEEKTAARCKLWRDALAAKIAWKKSLPPARGWDPKFRFPERTVLVDVEKGLQMFGLTWEEIETLPAQWHDGYPLCHGWHCSYRDMRDLSARKFKAGAFEFKRLFGKPIGDPRMRHGRLEGFVEKPGQAAIDPYSGLPIVDIHVASKRHATGMYRPTCQVEQLMLDDPVQYGKKLEKEEKERQRKLKEQQAAREREEKERRAQEKRAEAEWKRKSKQAERKKLASKEKKAKAQRADSIEC